jgi:hypothetical protein
VSAFVGYLLAALAAALALFSLLGILSVGIFVLPFAGIAVVAAMRFQSDPGIWGLPLGLGLTTLYVGFTNLDYRPCPANGVLVLQLGQHEVSCGGWSPTPWLIVGGVLVAVGVLGFAATALRQRTRFGGRT